MNNSRLSLLPLLALLLLSAGAVGICADSPALSISASQLGNLFYLDQPIELTLNVPGGMKGTVTWVVTDFDGKRVGGGSLPAKDGVKFKPVVKEHGIYYVTCTPDRSAGPAVKTSFAVVHKLSMEGRKASPFAINGGALFHISLDDIKTIGEKRLVHLLISKVHCLSRPAGRDCAVRCTGLPFG